MVRGVVRGEGGGEGEGEGEGGLEGRLPVVTFLHREIESSDIVEWLEGRCGVIVRCGRFLSDQCVNLKLKELGVKGWEGVEPVRISLSAYTCLEEVKACCDGLERMPGW